MPSYSLQDHVAQVHQHHSPTTCRHSLNTRKEQPEEGERGWLPVTLEKCLGALSILQNNQGRSQAPPVASGCRRKRTRWRDRTQPGRGSRTLSAPYILEKEQEASPVPLPPASFPPTFLPPASFPPTSLPPASFPPPSFTLPLQNSQSPPHHHPAAHTPHTCFSQ